MSISILNLACPTDVIFPLSFSDNLVLLSYPNTTKDLMVKYHQNGAIVQELINGKLISGDWKAHPEFPGRDETSQHNLFLYFFKPSRADSKSKKQS